MLNTNPPAMLKGNLQHSTSIMLVQWGFSSITVQSVGPPHCMQDKHADRCQQGYKLLKKIGFRCSNHC